MFGMGICEKYQSCHSTLEIVWLSTGIFRKYLSQTSYICILDSGWSILNEFGGLRHVRDKKWNTFSQIPRRVKKVKSFIPEHFRVSSLNNHDTLRIKVKQNYSGCIWRFDAREGKTVKSSCKYLGSGKNERNWS